MTHAVKLVEKQCYMDQLRAQRSATSMGSLYLYLFTHAGSTHKQQLQGN